MELHLKKHAYPWMTLVSSFKGTKLEKFNAQEIRDKWKNIKLQVAKKNPKYQAIWIEAKNVIILCTLINLNY